MTDLRKAQLLQLKIAKEIQRVCEENHIPVFIFAGTLLGAVRHKGFIPWDDDLDVAMLREDYDKFLQIAPKSLGEEFFLQNWETDPEYALPFSKVLLKNTHYTERNIGSAHIQDGIYVDIFVLDNVPRDEKLQKKHDRSTYLLQRLLLAKNGYCPWQDGETVKKLIYQCLKLAALPFSRKSLQKRLDRQMRKYSGGTAECVTAIGGCYGYQKEKLKREWAVNLASFPFEDTELPGIADFDAYLSYLYGDYMTPPPESERENRHGIMRVDFGPYQFDSCEL